MIGAFSQGADRTVRTFNFRSGAFTHSRANREGSDIDIVVISDDFTGKSYWERIDINTRLDNSQPFDPTQVPEHTFLNTRDVSSGHSRLRMLSAEL